MKKWPTNKIRNYIDSQTWYQTIELSNGMITPGTTQSKERLKYLSPEEVKNKSVLDIGCNSGYYCLWAKKNGAGRVVGIDILEKRIKQAKTIAEIENVDIEYYKKGIFNIENLGEFDIVYCFAVLTEIPDLLGAFNTIKNITKEKAFIELAMAKPIIYLSFSKNWIKGLIKRIYSNKNSTGLIEMRHAKTGMMLSPSLTVIKDYFSDKFKVRYLGKGLRYEMLVIEKNNY